MMGRTVVVLTGAGVSAESGLPTFREAGGLWERHRIEEVATPEAFSADPGLVHRFYNARRRQLQQAAPNLAHQALAHFERAWPGEVVVITQNVDDLHERAGSRRLIHMHGELTKSRCTGCGAVAESVGDLTPEDRCGRCLERAPLRPHIVWFGEIPLRLEEIAEWLGRCALFVAVGTSASVYPAAGFVWEAKRVGARTVELNREPSDACHAFDEVRYGPATSIVPGFVSALLGSVAP